MNETKYELRILPLFETDLNEIVDYICNQLENPIAADAFVDAVREAIFTRLSYPKSVAPYPSTKKRKYPYYPINVKNYTIFYVVIDHVMEVRRILYSPRNLPAFLEPQSEN